MSTTNLLTLAGALLIAAAAYVYETTRFDDAAVKVLFIGNSLTSSNDLPAAFAEMAEAQDISIHVDAHAPGGARLSQHARSAAVKQLIAKHDWDFIILQEQSQIPGFSDVQVEKDMYPFARALVEHMRETRPNVSPVFYMTMARKNGDPANQAAVPQLATYAGAQHRTNRSYALMARRNDALLSPVGEVWRIVRKERPDIELYSDNVHPNRVGTYLAACVIFATLFETRCSGGAGKLPVQEADVEYLQNVVADVVLSSPQKWDWRP